MNRINYSTNKAMLAHVPKEMPKHDWQLSKNTRQNSLVLFMKDYQGNEQVGEDAPQIDADQGGTKPSALVRRPSVMKATQDITHLLDTKRALLKMGETFHDINLPTLEAFHGFTQAGIHSKYTITDDGAMFVINRIDKVRCSAETAMELLWDPREETVVKIWKQVIGSCEVIGELTPRQRILHIKFVKPSFGLAGGTSARDVAVIANRYPTAIVMGSITTSMVPEEEDIVRGEARVLGFVVVPLSEESCSITLATEFSLGGAFDSGCLKCFMKMSGIDMSAAQQVAVGNSKALKRLLAALESVGGAAK
eukprot:CAMPEP_0119299406 /NCGR_PEP_ID=MMETSP1333-20130426/1487_1 /TAXON_ID=418940 /ORGANISM="Scyphosphaera apsteinii, Strain RCC1455" /LENGTH=307 /DNA_ID=CAMNT_0007300823 /DNA_START=50 /DNA_END=973 /DNA_ORIENTATION=-